MGEKRTLNLVVCEEKDLSGGKKLYKLMTQDGQKYDCWSAKIKEFVGKGPREYEVYSKHRTSGENTYTDWYIDLGDSKGGRGGGGPAGGRGGYVVAFNDTREGAILRTKAMVLSYAKDLVVGAAKPETMVIEGMVNNTKEAYKDLLKLLDLDAIPAEAAPPPAAGKSNGSGTKSLAVLTAEIRALVSMASFATWWNNNQASIKALSPAERSSLYEAKAEKTRELEPAGSMSDAGDIPF